MTLVYQNNILVLQNAQFSNNYKPTLNVQIKTAMDGSKFSYANPTNTLTQTLHIIELYRGMIIDLFAFLKNTMGKDITLIDHDGTTWVGKLLNDPMEVVAAGKNNNPFDLLFEGIQNG